MKRSRLIASSILAFSLFNNVEGYSQRFYDRQEYGLSAAATQYFGDLNPDYGFNTVKPAGGVFYRYYFNPYISARLNLMYGQIAGDDKNAKHDFEKARNLNFKSNFLEASVVGEFNFFYFQTGNPDHRFTPYITLGVGGIYANPFTEYGGRKIFLQPLGTEGQNMEAYKDRQYHKVNVVVPVGAGVKYWISPGLNLGFELVHRFTTTDYLDDVSTTYVGAERFLSSNGGSSYARILQDRSDLGNGQKLGREGKQRGNSATKDQYFMAQLTLSFQFKTYKCPSYEGQFWQ